MSTKPKSSKAKDPKSTAKRHLKPKVKAKPEAKPVAAADPNNPFRPTSMYGVLFREGSQDYIAKADLIKKVAELTGKSEKVIGYAFQVIKARNHKSNGGRSCMLEENGLVKFVRLQRPSSTV